MPGSNYQWWDIFKLWTFSQAKDPISRKRDDEDLQGAGVSQPDIPDIRGDGSFWGNSGQGSLIRLNNSANEFVDLSTVTNRQSRYKEYERLRNIAEIENCMTVFADEACVSGDTKVATPFGFPTIQWLAENKAKEKFLVYCWDFEKEDYSFGWAFNPRKTGRKKTIKIALDNGHRFVCTPDHQVLLYNGEWKAAGDLEFEDKLMPFYKIQPNTFLNDIKLNLFPRIFTFTDGWTNERLFTEKWKTGKVDYKTECVQKAIKYACEGLIYDKIGPLIGHDRIVIRKWMKDLGFTAKEVSWLAKKEKYRTVMGTFDHDDVDVYDISVEKHKCFATDHVIMHNCQKDDKGHVCTVDTESHDIKEEVEWFLYRLLQIDRHAWNWFKNLCIYGDNFFELILNPQEPKDGIQKVQMLPADSVYRIETVKGRLVEFQQSKEGPDYQSLTRNEVTQATETDLMQATAIRFAPQQVVHMRIGEDRKTFYPYGQSIIEPARGPAHMLRLQEDSMVVYRLCLVGNTRIRTPESYKYLENLLVGDEVFCYNELGRPVSTKVVNFVDNGVQDLLRVRSKHVELVGTKTHPVLVDREGVVQYVDMQDILPNTDKLINVRRESENKASEHETEFARMLGFCYGNQDFESLPDWIYRSGEEIVKSVVKGISNACGKERFKNGVWYSKISCDNRKMVDDVKELWSSIGLVSGHIKEKNNKFHLTISDEALPDLDLVVEVITFGRDNVYDITVENDCHNFIANGVPVHNTRAPERRIFYIDVGGIAPFRAEAFMERMKDQFKKRKTSGRGGANASNVEERWHAPAVDEDYWVPLRPNSNTRIETLPGAQHLDQIEDVKYFRDKLFLALNFPKNYLNAEDVNQTRISLSAQDVRFARLIERLQASFERGLWEMTVRHLYLRGYPEESYEDLQIKMTPPSDWRELSRSEVDANRLNKASTLKSSQLASDYDIMIDVFQLTEDEAKAKLARLKVQKLEDLKLQIIANNPQLLGVGLPGEGEETLGAEPGQQNPQLTPPPQGAPGMPLSPDQGLMPGGAPPGLQAGMKKYMDADDPDASVQKQNAQYGVQQVDTGGAPQQQNQQQQKPQRKTPQLPVPNEEDIKKYDLTIRDYTSEQDEEDIDFSEL